jgi:acylphosphatase
MNDKSNELVRAHIWIRGLVQGVGFRAHVEHFALQWGVKGWVRNVGWDAVEVLVEGPRNTVEPFIDMVKKGPRMARVDETTVDWEPVTGHFTGFLVKHNI